MSASPLLTPPPPLRLRPMTPADIDAVVALENAAYARERSRTGYEYELEHNDLAYYVVLTWGAAPIIGQTGHWLIGDEAHVSTIAVQPAWQGLGLGALLLLQLLTHACAQAAILATLEVRRSNLTAQKLYCQFGFEFVGERRRYYRDNGEDALLMTVTPLDAAYRARLAAWQADLWPRLAAITGPRPGPDGAG